MKQKEYINEGVAYFSALPKLIQEEVVARGVPINSKSKMEKVYDDILKSGPNVVGMEDEDIRFF